MSEMDFALKGILTTTNLLQLFSFPLTRFLCTLNELN